MTAWVGKPNQGKNSSGEVNEDDVVIFLKEEHEFKTGQRRHKLRQLVSMDLSLDGRVKSIKICNRKESKTADRNTIQLIRKSCTELTKHQLLKTDGRRTPIDSLGIQSMR